MSCCGRTLSTTLWNIALCAAEKLKGLLSFYRSLRDEYDYWLSGDLVEGTVPAELQGTLFRCAGGEASCSCILCEPSQGHVPRGRHKLAMKPWVARTGGH